MASKLRHPYIVKLNGYCGEHGQHLVVYEFVRNLSLELDDALHNEAFKPLSWELRLCFALGIARALDNPSRLSIDLSSSLPPMDLPVPFPVPVYYNFFDKVQAEAFASSNPPKPPTTRSFHCRSRSRFADIVSLCIQ
ncbi:hypothetical protein CCACVL1_19622, partial [Corchorus capsularis]